MTGTMTVEEFAKLPENSGVREELVKGNINRTPPATLAHRLLERAIAKLLARYASEGFLVDVEIPFTACEGHVFVADVAVLREQRIAASTGQPYLAGSPELVIEIVSPSNTAEDILRRERLTLAGGAHEFWAMYPEDKIVRVSYADGRIATYGESDTVPVSVFNSSVPAVELFG